MNVERTQNRISSWTCSLLMCAAAPVVVPQALYADISDVKCAGSCAACLISLGGGPVCLVWADCLDKAFPGEPSPGDLGQKKASGWLTNVGICMDSGSSVDECVNEHTANTAPGQDWELSWDQDQLILAVTNTGTDADLGLIWMFSADAEPAPIDLPPTLAVTSPGESGGTLTLDFTSVALQSESYEIVIVSASGPALNGDGFDIVELIPCEADANGDGEVDPLDAGYVLARFGCPVGTGDPSCDAADVNGDGEMNPLDSGFVLARYGQCL